MNVTSGFCPDGFADRYFVEHLLPGIEKNLNRMLRTATPELREELTQDARCHAWLMFRKLYEAGRVDDAKAYRLALYGLKRAIVGRKFGTAINTKDIMARYRKWVGFAVRPKYRPVKRVYGARGWVTTFGAYTELFVRRDMTDRSIREFALADDRRTTPADLAAYRIDSRDWQAGLPLPLRNVLKLCLAGYRTREIALELQLTRGRVSQLRRLLAESWFKFHNEEPQF